MHLVLQSLWKQENMLILIQQEYAKKHMLRDGKF